MECILDVIVDKIGYQIFVWLALDAINFNFDGRCRRLDRNAFFNTRIQYQFALI